MTNKFTDEPQYVEKPISVYGEEVWIDVLQGRRSKSILSSDSPIVNGKMRLQANWLEQHEYRESGYFPVNHTETPDYDVFEALPEGYVESYQLASFSGNVTPIQEVALRKFYSKLSNVDYLLAEYLLEMRKTVDSINDSILSLVKMAKRIKHGRVGLVTQNIKELDEDFAGAWLSNQFMWMPLLSDIHNRFNDIQTQAYGLQAKARAKGHKMRKEEGTRTSPLRYTALQFAHDIAEDIRVTVTAIIKPFTSVLSGYMNSIGLGDPGLVAWNFLPFSFVVDWLYPCGKYFEALDAADSFHISDASITTRSRVRVSSKQKLVPIQGYTVGVKGEGDLYSSHIYKRRSLGLPGVPPPENQFSLGLDGWKITTSIALLRSVFGR